MSFDGGFGAVLYVREALFDEVIGAVHFRHGDQLATGHSGTVSFAGRQVSYSGHVYLDRPRLSLRRADAAARLDLQVRGRLGIEGRAVTVVVTATALAPVRLDVPTNQWSTPLYVDLSALSVQSISISAATPDGLELPPVAVSDVLARALVDAVRPLAGNLLRFAIPLQVLTEMQFSAAVAGVVLPTVRPATVAVLDGCLAACFDCTGPHDEWRTSGNPQQVEPPWSAAATRMSEQFTMVGRSITKSPEEMNMAVAFAPRLVTASLAETLKLQIMKKPPIAGLVIDRVDVTLRSGAVDLHIEVTAPAPDPFAGHVKVTIDTSVVPTGDYLTLVRNDVDFDSSWFLEFLATVHSWWTGITVEGMVRGSIAGQVGYANLVMSRIKAGGELPLSAGSPGRPTFHVLPEGTAVDPGFVIAGAEAGVHVASALNLGWWCVDDPRFLPTFTTPFDPHPYHPELPKREELLPQTRPTPAGEASVHIRRSRAEIILEHLHPLIRRDPTLRLRWTVTAFHPHNYTTVTVLSREGWANESGMHRIDLDLWSADIYTASELTVRLEYLRPPGNVLVTSIGEIDIDDRFRRDKPFVRWKRHLNWINPEGQHGVTARASVIHKTSVHERCKFGDTGGSRPFDFEYFDSLPAPDREGFRSALCPHCF